MNYKRRIRKRRRIRRRRQQGAGWASLFSSLGRIAPKIARDAARSAPKIASVALRSAPKIAKSSVSIARRVAPKLIKEAAALAAQQAVIEGAYYDLQKLKEEVRKAQKKK